MRYEQRQVEQGGDDSPPAKAPALDDERDGRSTEHPERRGGGRRRGSEYEGLSQLDVRYESFASLDACGCDQLGDRRDKEEKEKRAEEAGEDRSD